MTSNAPAVTPGTLLAHKYRVERILGQGGMGYVVEAKHVALDERVALKFLLPEYAQHPEAATRFLREARAAVKIKSEHVARVSDHGTLDNGAPYMVMEFLDGKDLAKILSEKGVLSIEDAIDYVLQGCEAIAEAHSYGIVHRDLKPANLFLAKRIDGSPLVKVLDFGISKMTSSAAEHALTKTSTAMGSALYMSPEQMQETRGVDHRTDIYSLGIALYELLAGKQPFYAETLPQLCAEVLTGVPKRLVEYRKDVPPDLAAKIEKAYERDKAKRYQSIGEFVVALAPYAPARSQSTIDRVARMSGLVPPTAGVRPGGTLAMPQVGSTTASLASTALPSAQASTGPIPAQLPVSSTMPGPGQTTAPVVVSVAPALTTVASAGTNPAAVPPKTIALPATALVPEFAVPNVRVGASSTSALGVAMPEPEVSRIEAESYSGPMSAHAAAAFAHAAKARPANAKSILFAALAIGALIGVGGGAAVFALRGHAEGQDETSARTNLASPGKTAIPESVSSTKPAADVASASTATTTETPTMNAMAPSASTSATSAASVAPGKAPPGAAIPSKPQTKKPIDVFEER